MQICRALSVALGFEKQVHCPLSTWYYRAENQHYVDREAKDRSWYCMACHKHTFGIRTSWMQVNLSSYPEKIRTAGPLKP